MLTATRSQSLKGEISMPGDKSISHRAVLLGSLAQGTTVLKNFLFGDDCLRTVTAMQRLGVPIHFTCDKQIEIQGVGIQNFKQSLQPIDCGNSGTLIRMLSGVLAATSFETILTGDASLCNRPMDRIIEPLQKMGTKISGVKKNGFITPPLLIKGNKALQSIEYTLPIPSAQVKSCLLMAGLFAQGSTSINEPEMSRDHTERLLPVFGVSVLRQEKTVKITPGILQGTSLTIPGDISSAAFFIVAAALIPNSHLIIKNVGLNPTRMGLLQILRLMGADIRIKIVKEFEPYGEIEIRSSTLQGVEVPPSLIVSAIDEFPVLFIAGAFAKGDTIVKNLTELRVKESDRLQTMTDGLRACGVNVELMGDNIRIQGGGFTGGEVFAHQDHRVAMAFACAGWICDSQVKIREADAIHTSFPDFVLFSQNLGLNICSSL